MTSIGNKEVLKRNDVLSSITGIEISTKGMSSSCHLAEMIARSGINDVLPQFDLNIRTHVSEDYQCVARAGNASSISALGGYQDKSFTAKFSGDIVYLVVDTLMTDNWFRPVPIFVGLKGLRITDRKELWDLMQQLFPKIRFSVSTNKISYEIQEELASQNILPLPVFDLSENLPLINLDDYQHQNNGPNSTAEVLTGDELVQKVRELLDIFERDPSKKDPVMWQLSDIIPDFGGYRQGNNSYVYKSGARIWTIEELKDWIKTMDN